MCGFNNRFANATAEVSRLYHAILYKRLEHPQISASVGSWNQSQGILGDDLISHSASALPCSMWALRETRLLNILTFLERFFAEREVDRL